MQTETLAELESRWTALARAAAGGDAAAAASLVTGLEALAEAPPCREGWPRPGSVAFMAFDAFLKVEGADRALLGRLAGPFLRVIAAHSETMSVPYRFEPAKMLGPSAIPLLVELLDRGMRQTSRAAIEALGEYHPGNEVGFKLASDAVTRLLAYEDGEAVAAGLLAIEWTDERMWLLFRVLTEAHALRPGEVAPGIRAALARLVAETATITGSGADRLRALLLRAKVIPKAMAPGVKLTTLPKQLPQTVAEALALMGTWNLAAAEVPAKGPAKPREIEALAKQVSPRLPKELTQLLAVHAALGDREFGPPARMRQLVRELAETLEEDDEDADEAPSGRGKYDVRGFDPGKKAIPLGSDPSGDMFFLATGAKSGANAAPVIRYHHDQTLVATLAADSLGEYVALLLARAYARREGIEAQFDKLEGRKRTIVSGYKPPKQG
ncbi:hypothetical protein [Nannocystis punicea]|uniref:Uncharacterized protein n=1 Tax=Nannocystis punicea TaxID=2995304 RepID=A0ABY7HFV7_9BACT|nr:hypothetical protein [Nannocystis poenicansa]WAS98086.1 hypothetical protein O0S08_18260 [Nannocystis poenicansa]